jgi:AraC-like DNA-binding protein
MHSHDCWEIILNLDGSGTEVTDIDEFKFSSGDIFVCPPGMNHSKVSTGCFRDVYAMIEGNEELEHLSRLRFVDNELGFFRQLMLMLHQFFHDQNAGCSNITCTLCDSLVEMLVSWDGRDRFSAPTTALKRTIIEKFSDPAFSLTDQMDAMYLSRDHIRRCFKKEVGISPQAYLTRIRIEQARRILAGLHKSHLSIGDVALMVGFYDSQYFCKVFKKMTGVCPTHYAEDINNYAGER